MKAILIFFTTILTFGDCYDKEITITVEAGKEDCFYHPAKVGDIIDIEYQVIDGDQGDLDISFELTEPIGRIIFADFKKSENVHRHSVQVEGDYRFCFDNRFSSFNSKTIFFEIIVENENGQNSEFNQDILEGLTPEEFYELKVQDIMNYIGRIRQQITKARQIQDIIRSHEARDRNIAEANFYKVNAWSTFQICAMIAVGLLQVFMVKSIFDTSGSKITTFWKKINF
ncbi:transmembrane emp24 domain-containing protein 5 [Condylostylus longicornis]|uniref:transmembrane emp24 domain-containing protein 5 n=1 Tax=Condylostylus longicornis TaxID=2530218 RepID=UPI00244E0CC9|nr:transmembrane emp24 domain-containing protein 5 [Condylostylus longicornis]